MQFFSLEARFSLRTDDVQKGRQNTSGRLIWTHQGRGDNIEFISPLGQTVAELALQPGLARLRTADGKVREGPDAQSLLEQKARLILPPLERIPDWLLGRGSQDARVEFDAQQRPQRLTDQGWQIDYDYADTHVQALPRQITVRLDEQIELRLRPDQWQIEHE